MKMWDGRFSKPSAELMEAFNNSLPFDRELWDQDIRGSIAWANALARASVITRAQCTKIVTGLKALMREFSSGAVRFDAHDEDIHMAVERLLTERIGTTAQWLHTGRSRNDQVATDFRLYAREALTRIAGRIERLQQALLGRAETEQAIIVPGYTHLQQAQPVSLAHYWLSFFFLLQREKVRFQQAAVSADLMPLGSGACAGCGFEIDRQALAAELGFSAVTDNSMDGVAGRDFVMQALSAFASLGVSLSRYAEDLIIWSSQEFGFVELDDAWSTGSSMMPQKKNPDSLELIRGKAGRFVGNYTRFAVTLKGVGLTYFKDLQEDKEPLFDSVRHMELVLEVFGHVISTLAVHADRIALRRHSFLLATDLADYLARKGVPFRTAHKVVGRIVAHCVHSGQELTALTLQELQQFDAAFQDDVLALFDWQQALKGRDVQGGTGPRSVRRQIATARRLLAGRTGRKR